MIILHFHLQPQFIYELFHINFTSIFTFRIQTPLWYRRRFAALVSVLERLYCGWVAFAIKQCYVYIYIMLHYFTGAKNILITIYKIIVMYTKTAAFCMVVSRQFPGSHLYRWAERSIVRVKCLSRTQYNDTTEGLKGWRALTLNACHAHFNRPYSYSRYWTGTSMQWRLMRGNIIEKRLMSFAFEKTPRINLSCELVPVHYREYENDLLKTALLPVIFTWDFSLALIFE